MPLLPSAATIAAAVLAAGLAALGGAPAWAQGGPAAIARVGAGVNYTPEYFGSEDYAFSPSASLRFDYLRLPGGLEFGSINPRGFIEGFKPRFAVNYIGSRTASDSPELREIENVDAALELGFGLGYEAEYWRAFGDVRYGVAGHHSWTGDFGADAILRPNDAWVINFGPRASWGAGRFMDTYFGVSQEDSIDSGLAAYEPDAGFYGVGMELGARYAFSESWGVEGRAVYERLIDEAADSPIVEQGTVNQIGLQVLITRNISLGF